MQLTHNSLRFGPHSLVAAGTGSEAAPYFLAGSKLYCIGLTNGDIQPIGAEHLVGEMGGLWTHPVKVADGITLAVADQTGLAAPARAGALTQALSHLEWRYRVGDLELRRRDFVVEDDAAFVSLVDITNAGASTYAGTLQFTAWLKFLGCWFGGLARGEAEYWLEDGVVLGYDQLRQGRWGVACGATVAPARCEFAPGELSTAATLSYPFRLAPGAAAGWEFTLAADHERGHVGARELFGRLAGSGERLLDEKIARYQHVAFGGAALATPDAAVDRAFALAKVNLQLLSAGGSAQMPPYFLAGVPEYPQLFGCDTAYTAPGATAAGFGATTRSALLALAAYGARACGRIPHELTTNGRVFHPGNTQETPQFATACWDYFRWSGDRAFLEQVYPLCQEGLDDYLPMLWGGGGSPYPIGDGVVERQGMGSRKLDSTCYLFQALRALADMSVALDRPADAERYERRQAELNKRFEQDWWLAEQCMYADSLHTDGTPQLDGHWTVVLPLQLGLASDERARQSLARIEREWVNEWGLVHTHEREPLVWTLPTGLLALTAFQYGDADLGLSLLQRIAETTKHGMLGAFKELIPIGLCFVQLWSAGLYVQGLLEGLFGLRPLAHLDRLAIHPQLPTDWPVATLHNLAIGEHIVNVQLTHSGCVVEHARGSAPLDLRYRVPASVATIVVPPPTRAAAQLIRESDERLVQVSLRSGQAIEIGVGSHGREVTVAHHPALDR